MTEADVGAVLFCGVPAGEDGIKAAETTSTGLTAVTSALTKVVLPELTIAAAPVFPEKATVPFSTLMFTVSNSKLVPRTEACPRMDREL